MTHEKILEDFQKSFPKAWGKPGSEFDGGTAVVWSGEGSELNDGHECFDSAAYDWDPNERQYVMGIARALINWAAAHKCHWECHDPGTYLLYED